MQKLGAVILFLAGMLALPSYAGNPTAYVMDAKESKLEIHVYREGFLKAFGHDHLSSPSELSGTVHLDESNLSESSVMFVVETKSLMVLDPGESEKDRKEVQETMLGEKVLDAGRFPEIRFVSTRVQAVGQKDGATEMQVDGTLSLHGVQKPVRFPVRFRARDGALTADGEVTLLQSAYGITPVKVGGGAVRVKDKLKISFHVVAREKGGSE